MLMLGPVNFLVSSLQA
uniref:Uncharacterized protein n=1 Tax=Arundo donax TaxID=35708 RepID=A0A0A9A0T5_ARUDO